MAALSPVIAPIISLLVVLSVALAQTPGECGLACSSFQSDINMRDCLGAAFATDEAKIVTYQSNQTVYDNARTMFFGRTALPIVVVYANSTQDVVRTVECAWKYGFSVSVAGRRHSYQGWSVVSGYCVIDTSNIVDVAVHKENMTVAIGAGGTNAYLLSASTNSGIPGAMSLIGACPSVGVVGYALGGGLGDISPYVGLGCDQVVELEMVLFNGTVIRANKETHADVLWASCGGGPGLGVITQIVVKLHEAPNPDHFTYIQAALPADAAPDALVRFQNFLNNKSSDSNLFGGGGEVNGLFMVYTLVYLGPWEDAARNLAEADLLYPGMPYPTPPTLMVNFTNGSSTSIPDGVLTIREFPSYAYLEAYQVCNYNHAFPCEVTLGVGCTGPVDCDSKENLDTILTLAADPSSLLNKPLNYFNVVYPGSQPPTLFMSPGGLMVNSIPSAGWSEIISYLATASQGVPDACVKSVMLNHLAHGAVGDVEAGATAYPWRNETILISFGYFAVTDDTTGGADALLCHNFTIGLTNIVSKYVSQPNGVMRGYYNYMGNPQPQWQQFYFGDNYPRMQKIKAAYDPLNVFGKPVTMQAALSEYYTNNNDQHQSPPPSPSPPPSSSSALSHSFDSGMMMIVLVTFQLTHYFLHPLGFSLLSF